MLKKEGDILKYIVLFLIFRTHTHVKHVRARAYMTLISFIKVIRPARMTLRVISAKRAHISKNSNQEKKGRVVLNTLQIIYTLLICNTWRYII